MAVTKGSLVELKCQLLMSIIDGYSSALRQLDDREVCVLKSVQVTHQEFTKAVVFAMCEFQRVRERLSESALMQMEAIREIH